MGDCFWDTGYLASPDFMMFFSHVVTAGEVPISLYGAYCIVFQTPRKMREVKWLMFNLQLWSTLSDLIICFFGVPVFFMPSFAAFGFGAIDNAPLITYFGFTFFALQAISIMAVYENRYFILFLKSSQWSRVRKPLRFTIFLAVSTILMIPFLLMPEQEAARALVLERIPCLKYIKTHGRKMFVFAIDPIMTTIGATVLATALTTPTVTFFILTLKNLFKENKLFNISRKTFEAQQTFFKAITIQFVFFLLMMISPIIMILIIDFTAYHNQVLNNIVLFPLYLSGILSTIMMLIVHSPYRKFTRNLLCCSKKQQKQLEYPRPVASIPIPAF
ncbi:Serpentine Receptor, class H [Caenorhabditis elegans]|uniref:Serpentine Receptor, class H n=1 Tax=Caenorhabditis elegans TaxID=6239 RepID=O17126_CAEEL|nr:Serpentine Receptor, class H [Caenorhabditis elegans]CCD70336.1 Serpentine Receptor, class H [Caenorhabditis elegans]|eukprot:NP_503281.1 Serpentine Receptor, class H [Caenorhabditis elegans]